MKSFDLLFFQKEGFCLVDDIFTQKQCDELLAASHVLPSYQDETFIPVMNPHRLHERFFQAMRCSVIIEILEELFSGPVSGLQSQFFFCRPGTPGFSRHQDNYYVQAKQGSFVSTWIALDDVTSENGGLYAFPGSHTEAILPTEAVEPNSIFGQDPNANCRQVILPSHYVSQSLSIPRGSMVLIHGHVVHASHDNRSQRYRHALLLTYIKKGESFRKGFSAQRAEIDLFEEAAMSA